MNYKDTLHMPKTAFPMRGNLGQKEPDMQKDWDRLNLYEENLKKNKDNEPFILHDGPPYANGDIHLGHALNKILKDFVLRYQTMKGRYTRYIPGWDTHGLPIETALAKKGIKRKEMELYEYRELCYKYAMEQVERQKTQFKRLGVLGEWDHPYITLTADYEERQIKVFAKMVERGLIYKGLKPVYWSPSSESALAEAEIEYQDHTSTSIYVAFPSVTENPLLKDANYIIWTTTPWTIPANLAIAANPKMQYAIFMVNGKKYVAAQELLEKLASDFGWDGYEVLAVVTGKDLELEKYLHPLYGRVSPVILGDHVTAEDGSGLVHTAPGHGDDDYKIGRQYKLDILSPVDNRGFMTEEAGSEFAGLFYEIANDKIVEALNREGIILKAQKFSHSYPHDWRTKKPVIFRATPQWFASISKIKDELLDEIKHVDWLPTWGEVRLSNMVTNREDWVISRQRAWGVPIPAFYAENGDAILDPKVIKHVAALFGKHGSNVWYKWDAKDLLPEGFTHSSSPNNVFKKEMDIMDVWFDSGTSHQLMETSGESYPADLYLEGSDQYRGWFNSSLITGVAAFGKAPYKKVVSHGFTLDPQGRKMSKSLGNTVDPIKVMNQQGADLLRLWVASVDYQSDVKNSSDLMKQISESYRKIRNTVRFMLANISDFDPEQDYIGYSMRGNLNRVMTIKFEQLKRDILKAYDDYQFDHVTRLVMPFMINDLSAYYLDYTKDILYIEDEKNFERLSVQSTLYDLLKDLLILLTPIMPHTTSEAYRYLPGSKEVDVYLERMPENYVHDNKPLMDAFEAFETVRTVVLKALEDARAEKIIGKSLQAKLNLSVTKAQKDAIDYLDMKLHQVLIVSSVDLHVKDALNVQVTKAEGHTCARCWNVVDHVHDDELCDRCHDILKGV